MKAFVVRSLGIHRHHIMLYEHSELLNPKQMFRKKQSLTLFHLLCFSMSHLNSISSPLNFACLGVIENSCTLKTCEHYAVCKKGKCFCPLKDDCPPYLERVCASNGRIYRNDCQMKAESCKIKKTLLPVPMEKCGTSLINISFDIKLKLL